MSNNRKVPKIMEKEKKKINSKFERLLSVLRGNKYSLEMKFAAAEQIGFLQKEFAYELSYLLNKLYPLTMHTNFNTRCGAARAIGNLVPQCKQNSEKWTSSKSMGKLSEFKVSQITSLGKSAELTNTFNSETTLPDDYKDQVFNYNNNGIAELCQLTELLISQFESKDWFYRHGAVTTLHEIYKGLQESNRLQQIPPYFIEGIAYYLLFLICRDRFQDSSVSDATKLPVSDKACKLLAEILVHHIDQCTRIIDELIASKIFILNLCAWLLIKNVSAINASAFDPSWVEAHLKAAFNGADDDVFQDVATYAAEAIYPIVERFANEEGRVEIAKLMWDSFMKYDEINSYNQIVLDVTLKLFEKFQVSYFATEQGLETLFTCIIAGCEKSGSSAARKSGIALLNAAIMDGTLDVWYSYDIEKLTELLIKLNLNETDYNVEAIRLFENFKNLLDIQGFEFAEDYVPKICTKIATDKTNLHKLDRVIAVLISIGNYIKIDKENRVTFRGCTNLIAICLIYIICLSMRTKEPELASINKSVLKTAPIPQFLELFSFSPRKVLDYLPEIAKVEFGSFKRFIINYVALSIKEYRHESKKIAILEQLINEELTNFGDIFFPPINQNEQQSYAAAIASVQHSQESMIIDRILKQCTDSLPKVISGRETLMRAYYYTCCNNVMSDESLKQLIGCFLQQEDEYVASMAAFVAKEYALRHTESFMQVYLMTKKDKLSRGDAEFIDLFLTSVTFSLHQWCSFFVPQLLANRFKSQDKIISQHISHSLASSIRFLPLENKDNLEGIPQSLHQLKLESLEKLRPLFDPTLIKPMEVLPSPTVQPLDYQRVGINWLGFLLEFGLNGILADDMGLGKTFQTLCAVSTVHSKAINKGENPISLVFAPPNVVYHWTKEVNKFFPEMNVLKINKGEQARNINYKDFSGIIVTSYKMSEHFVTSRKTFKFVVLDEGHLIKNNQTKTAENITQIASEHRLILSGTPIQNGAKDLWSLFNFLMPGYLGTEKDFNQFYKNPIDKMFVEGTSDADVERGRQALDKLHSQVLPLILRRLKTDVMTSLLEKVHETVAAKPSELQELLLESHQQQIDEEEVSEATFVKLRFERSVNIHPQTVLEGGETTVKIVRNGEEQEITLRSEGTLEESGKLVALKELLEMLGYGQNDDESVLKEKVVIFCESETSIDYIINLVLTPMEISFIRFDNSITQTERDKAIDEFMTESGPDIFVTTKGAAGHGIELTIANNVIFFELNWNPATDIQAEDRVHRIGQKKQVKIFSIIMEGTIDERIEKSQKRKRMIMDSVIHDQKDLGDLDTTGLNQNIVGEMNEQPDKPLTFKQKIMEEISYDKDVYDQMDRK